MSDLEKYNELHEKSENMRTIALLFDRYDGIKLQLELYEFMQDPVKYKQCKL